MQGKYVIIATVILLVIFFQFNVGTLNKQFLPYECVCKSNCSGLKNDQQTEEHTTIQFRVTNTPSIYEQIYQEKITKRDEIHKLTPLPPVNLVQPHKHDPTKTPGVYMTFEPYWQCPPDKPKELVGQWGDGVKWVCGSRQLPEKSIIYSFGSKNNFQFEESLLENCPSCQIYIFDPTSNPPKNESALHFSKLALGAKDGNLTIGKKAYPAKKLTTIMQELNHPCLEILKIDIEGSEYSVVQSWMEETFPCFRQFLIETHGPNFSRLSALMHTLENNNFRLWSKEHNLLWEHGCEFSFIRFHPAMGYY